MKISLNTSSFSTQFISFLFLIIALVCFYFSNYIFTVIMLLLGAFLFSQKNTYLIPHAPNIVKEKIGKTLKTLDLNYEETFNGFSTKTVYIRVSNYRLLTLLQFKFDKVYYKQGEYLTKTLVKYQRYFN